MANTVSTKAHEAKGRAKETVGKATHDRGLRARGKGEQVKAQLKRTSSDVKGEVTNGARKVKGTLSR